MNYHNYVNQILYVITKDAAKAMSLCKRFILGGNNVRLGIVKEGQRLAVRS